MRLTNICAMFLWCLFGVNAVPSGCGHCMEQEENGLVQLVNLQPNVQSSHYHPRRARRFRRFRRYGAKTSTTGTTGTKGTTSTTGTTGTTSTTTTTGTTGTTSTTTTTRVVCGVIAGNEKVLSPPQNSVRFNPVPDVSDPFFSVPSECQCVGGIFNGSTPGYVGVVLTLTANFTAAYIISITSPGSVNGDLEVRVPAVRSGNQLFAETVAFNGVEGLGAWVIKLLDASGNPSIQKASRAKLEFALQSCDQILAVSNCVGNMGRGKEYYATNLALVGTTLSSIPTLLHFDVEVSSACCVPAFSGSGTATSQLQLEFTPGPSGFVAADGLSPDAIQVNWTRTPFFDRDFLGTNVTTLGSFGADVAPGFAGAPAAGRWSINASTDGAVAVINNVMLDPHLRLDLEPCDG